MPAGGVRAGVAVGLVHQVRLAAALAHVTRMLVTREAHIVGTFRGHARGARGRAQVSAARRARGAGRPAARSGAERAVLVPRLLREPGRGEQGQHGG